MTSYIDGNNGLTNFANIMGDENTFEILTTNDLIVNNSISLPSLFTGINATYNNNTYNISNFELANINGSRSNLQTQIDNLNPSLANNTGYWGSFWNNNDLTTTANTETLIPYTNADVSNNGIVYNNSHIQVLNEGIYLFVITAQIYSTNSNTATISFWLKKNGSAVSDTAFKEELKQTTKLVCFNFQLALQANDYIEIAWQTTDSSISLEYFPSSSNIPAIPSVIVTASQVTYYQNNTAEVNDIKQRITGITYNSNITTTDISGNLNVTGRITRPTYVSPEGNNEYTMKQYVDNQDASYNNAVNTSILNYYNLNQTDLANTNQKITGISYSSPTDTTTIDNNVIISGNANVSGNLNIQVLNGSIVPLNSYIDQQVNVAYQRANYGIDLANNAQNTANNAQDTANNAQNTANGAMSLASGASAGVAGLGTVVAQHTTDIAALGAGLAIADTNITALQVKTQNINAIIGETTFTGQVLVGDTTINSATIFTPTIDAETAVYTPTINSNTATINIIPAVQNLQGTTINIGKLSGGSIVNVATDGTLNQVNIGNLTTPVYINSTLYVPFTPANLTSFMKQFTY